METNINTLKLEPLCLSSNYSEQVHRPYDHLIKVVLVGDSGVGKTSLLMRFADNTFDNKFIATIGIDFRIRTVSHNGQKVKLQLWDTAGQERFRSIISSYYRGVNVVVLCYDISNQDSFIHIEHWLKDIKEKTIKNILVVLCGTKLDLQRQVPYEQAREFAISNHMIFYETSSKDDVNVNSLFDDIISTVITNKNNPNINDEQNNNVKILLHNNNITKTKTSCC